MKVTFYGGIAVAAIAAQAAKAVVVEEEDEQFYAQLFNDVQAAPYAETEASSLAELESQGDESDFAEVDSEDDSDEWSTELAQNACKPVIKKPLKVKLAKGKAAAAKTATKAKIAAAKEKGKKKVNAKKAAVDHKKKTTVTRKAAIGQKL
mmetsp:Transcript_1206/g.1842  ORF Transcript_1206/g.1842 Transcript_1206/m.1842 type:complete len:150 (-) Transcript_1206:1532-1981(-)